MPLPDDPRDAELATLRTAVEVMGRIIARLLADKQQRERDLERLATERAATSNVLQLVREPTGERAN